MNNKHYKIAAFILLSVIVGSFTHCVQNTPIGGSSVSSSSRSPSGSPPPPTPEQVLNQAQVEVGLKNFEQLNYTFSELTGIQVGTVNATYNSVEATLPTDNQVKVLQSSNQVAITRLAAEYCSLLAGNATQRDRVFGPGTFVNIVPNNVNKRVLIENMTDAFWGEGVVEQVELDQARAMLIDLFDDIVSMDAAPNATATTNKAVRGVCTAALSSAYVTLM